MKKIIATAAFAILVLSSFTLVHKRTLPGTQALPKGKSFRVGDTYTIENETGITCRGVLFDIPQLTISYEYFGVANGNVFMVQGREKVTGIGVNPANGETFVIDFNTKFSQKIPQQNGAVVIREATNNCFKGSLGTLDCFTYSQHLTVNANGEVAADKSGVSLTCQ